MLKINPSLVEKVLVSFIKEELFKTQFKKAIIGLSGGVDSSVCTFLATKALSPAMVIGLIMPYGQTFNQDIDDAREVAQVLGIQSYLIDISPTIDAYYSNHPTANKKLKGNKMARERMAILYDFSAREKAIILGTSNKTELLLGYGTIHGDMACGLNPLGDLYKTQIRQLAAHLGLPQRICDKTPTAGLWPGQTDEKELGFTYEKADQILYLLVDERKSKKEVIAAGFQRKEVEKIINLIKKSQFKRRLPPIPKLSFRTIGHDFLYPYDWEK